VRKKIDFSIDFSLKIVFFYVLIFTERITQYKTNRYETNCYYRYKKRDMNYLSHLYCLNAAKFPPLFLNYSGSLDFRANDFRFVGRHRSVG